MAVSHLTLPLPPSESVCGPRETGDNAGATYGIIGFTSYNGDLQDLLREYRQREPATFATMPEKHLGSDGVVVLINVITHSKTIIFEQWG